MAEFKEHTENAVFADPSGQFFRGHPIGFSNGEDIVTIKNLAAKFMEKIEDARRIGNHLMD